MRLAVLIGLNLTDGKSAPIMSGTPNDVRRMMKDIRSGKEKCKFEEVRYFDQYYQKCKVKPVVKKTKAPKSGKDSIQE